MSRSRRAGFTLLEVMVAVAILAIGLGAVFSAEAGSVRMMARARKMSVATLLTRCKMGELDEDFAKKGLPATEFKGQDNCCKDAPIEGYTCKWEVMPIILPDTMFNMGDDKNKNNQANGSSGSSDPFASASPGSGAATGKTGSGSGLSGLLGAASALLGNKGGLGSSDSSKGLNSLLNKDGTNLSQDPSSLLKDGTSSKDGKDDSSKDGSDKLKNGKEDPKDLLSGDPSRFLSGNNSGGEVDGLTAMAMQYVYPVLKPSFEGQIRRVTVKITWPEGAADKSFEVTQYVVAEQPVPLATDPNNPNGLGTGTTGSSFGTTGSSFGTGTGTTGTMGTGFK